MHVYVFVCIADLVQVGLVLSSAPARDFTCVHDLQGYEDTHAAWSIVAMIWIHVHRSLECFESDDLMFSPIDKFIGLAGASLETIIVLFKPDMYNSVTIDTGRSILTLMKDKRVAKDDRKDTKPFHRWLAGSISDCECTITLTAFHDCNLGIVHVHRPEVMFLTDPICYKVVYDTLKWTGSRTPVETHILAEACVRTKQRSPPSLTAWFRKQANIKPP
jgi:hypothetical protein